MARTLAYLMGIFAAIDGLCHLALVILVTHGVFTRPPISVLFALNFVGYVVLIAALIISQGSSLGFRRLLDAVLIVYPIATFAAWIVFTRGRGNPLGLAEIAKPAEILLALAAIGHLVQLGHEEEPGVVSARG